MYTCLRSNILELDRAREARGLRPGDKAGRTRIRYGCEDQAEGKNKSWLPHYGDYPSESQRLGGAVPWYSHITTIDRVLEELAQELPQFQLAIEFEMLSANACPQ